MTVDGVDCHITEKTPFDKKWFSHKFNGPGLRYEVGVCIRTGDIVWINGPFKCGEKNDMQIFVSRLMKKLDTNEKVEADMGYQGMPTKVRHPRVYISLADKKAKGRARARHESINGRIKIFRCIGETFRHNIKKHKSVFLAAATVTQLCFDCGETPFQIKY